MRKVFERFYESISRPSMWLDVTSTWEVAGVEATKVTMTPPSQPAVEYQVCKFVGVRMVWTFKFSNREWKSAKWK